MLATVDTQTQMMEQLQYFIHNLVELCDRSWFLSANYCGGTGRNRCHVNQKFHSAAPFTRG
ncbi:hypothetical protein [Gloeocapsopsis dulcis]|uniref:hypothetical protein n=1 Tax=Gloeocapsopsis dulcis TaxID=2859516 RepID=UPI002B25E391|nr:hypothetical protein [Gloeocapsopsis dulcis]WNN92108.1 hypothetical protein P0S91_26305 [Gloeocapsopsis dulcis]